MRSSWIGDLWLVAKGLSAQLVVLCCALVESPGNHFETSVTLIHFRSFERVLIESERNLVENERNSIENETG